jgi:alpha-1,2-rhamnosyltransferase
MIRIFIDCTRTVQGELHTGIQRFVRRTLRHAQALAARSADRVVVPVIIEGRHFVRLHELPPHPHEQRRSCSSLRKGEPVVFRPNDQLLMIDSAWHFDAWPALLWAQDGGARLNFVCHDLIPLQHPQLFESAVSDGFAQYLYRLVHHADRVFCVSHCIRAQLQDHISAVAPHRLAQIDMRVNYPGADIFDSDASPPGACRPALTDMLNACEDGPLLLMVSTMEPRKNHALVLRACEQAWAAGHRVRLCLVGRPGWKTAALLQELAAHPECNRQLFVWHDLNDVELEQCYLHAAALVYPSLAEGFGLPIAEAGWYRTPVLLSDTAIHREVGGPHAAYFDLARPDQLTSTIVAIARGQYRHDPAWPEQDRFRSWHRATEELLGQLLQPQHAQPAEGVA